MKKSIKAALYSGLIFPGTGHFSLQRYQRGMLFFVPTLLSLLLLVHYSLGKAYAIADQISLGKIPLDTATITALIAAPPTGTELLRLQIATWIIIVCWVVGIIDAYRLGKADDQSES